MHLNLDCMRDVLITLEDASFLQELTLGDIIEKTPGYSEDDIKYTILKLDEANFIDARIKQYVDGMAILGVKDITYAGHQFIANIRTDTVWNKVKDVSKSVGATSISAITQIASNVISEILKAQLGIPPQIT